MTMIQKCLPNFTGPYGLLVYSLQQQDLNNNDHSVLLVLLIQLPQEDARGP